MAAQSTMFTVTGAFVRKGPQLVSASSSGTVFLPTNEVLKIRDAVCFWDPTKNTASEIVLLQSGIKKSVYSTMTATQATAAANT
jgi:hypothetical protein